MEPERIDELIAGYALDALSPDDEREVEEHLRRSPWAREHLAGLQESASSLAYGVETPAPPARLRERILAETAAPEGSNVVALRSRWVAPVLGAAAAAAAGVAIGLAIWGTDLSSSLSAEREVVARQTEVLALVADPQANKFTVEGANGTLVVSRGGQAGLVLSGFEQAPAGKRFQAWVIEDGQPVSAGLFEGGGRQTIVPLTRPVPPGAVVAVTLEDEDGAAVPTNPDKPVLAVST
jgi:anti-sigma-K factor RskA